MAFLPDPTFMYRYTKHTLNVDRLWELKLEEIKQYQTKALKKMIKYANTTHMYKKKFSDAKVNIKNIKKIGDINQLPFVTKKDLRVHGASQVLPEKSKENNFYKVCTSGSTGKPVAIYRDDDSVALESTIILRIYKAHNIEPLKTRITNIGDFSIPNSYDEECVTKGQFKKMGFFTNFFSKNVQHLYAGEKINKLMEQINSFKPGFIISYPGTLIGLMQLRKQGYAQDINPKAVIVSGGVLDSYMKRLFEDTFDTKVFSLYAATEGGPVGFECPHGTYHVQSDLIYVEAIDKNKKHVETGKQGHLVVSRLYGRGTPILRYLGMDDIISLGDYEECDCGMSTQIIKSVEGRTSDSIVLPDGRIFPPATFTLIPGEVSEESGYDIVQRFQIIQNKIDELEISVVINDEFREKVESVDKILDEIKNRYQKLVGKKVNVNVKEVDRVKEDNSNPASLSSIVISKVKHDQWF